VVTTGLLDHRAGRLTPGKVETEQAISISVIYCFDGATDGGSGTVEDNVESAPGRHNSLDRASIGSGDTMIARRQLFAPSSAALLRSTCNGNVLPPVIDPSVLQ
jgi:hypothetical protein